MINAFNRVWGGFAVKYPSAAKWIREGGVSMIIFFFVNKMIFPEGEAKKKR
ncbi:MAG: hypothetical protein LUE16_07330 [Lachnospiraceae bacterium]|nr:hypothetical protein [Lachnospiraceae bacterium]